MKAIQRMLACLLCLILLLPAAVQADGGYRGYQSAHRFTLTASEIKRPNDAAVRTWTIKTANQDVTKELNSLVKGYADALQGSLKAPGTSNSRLTVAIRPSRTGLTWMSFMVQARTVYQEKNIGLDFTTRTYDMTSGERILLTDVFAPESEAWILLEAAVREGINGYFGDTAPEAAALENACTREAIAQMDFTLQGMSLVLHLNALDFYPGKVQMIEIPLYYPQIRSYMTEKAQIETDNATYYKTVALTYDDGPNGWITNNMLDVLLRTGEKATFFVVGEKIRQQAWILQREHDEGHAIATHNYQHLYANSTAREVLQTMPAKVHAAHMEVLGIPVRYCRAPGGQWEQMAAAELGWPLIQWTVEASDWSGENGPDPAMTSGNIFAGTDDGGIILMHDSRSNSIEASELFIKRLQEAGYIFLTVDELFAKDGVVLQPDTAYWRCTNGVITK